LAAQVCATGDRITRGVPALRGAWRQGMLRQAIDPITLGM